tara:strand:+ start:2281 stop:2952 length:672 start_codon:yes stop_codon:yes gene_type:complete
MIFIDIGSCVGLFVEEIFKKYDYSKISEIHCFEPHKANFNFLNEKYKKNKKIIINNFAISNKKGEFKFYMKNYNNKFDFAGNAGSSLKKNKNNIDKTNYEVVKVTKISEYIIENNLNRIELMKIDSEGSEYDIIFDILDSNLLEKINKIYFEDHSRKINLDIERKKFFEIINNKGKNIKEKFFLQDNTHTNYLNLNNFNYNSKIFRRPSFQMKLFNKLKKLLK